MRIGEVSGDNLLEPLKDVEQALESDGGERSAGVAAVQMSVQVSLLRNAQEFSAKLMDQLLG